MKVARKNVYVREDCFDAEEKGVRVQIQAYRNRINVTVWKPGESFGNQDELTLPELAGLLQRYTRKQK